MTILSLLLGAAEGWDIGAAQRDGWDIGAAQRAGFALDLDAAATTADLAATEVTIQLTPDPAILRLGAEASQLNLTIEPDPASLRGNAPSETLDGPYAEITLVMGPTWLAIPAPPQFNVNYFALPFFVKPQKCWVSCEPLQASFHPQLVPDPAILLPAGADTEVPRIFGPEAAVLTPTADDTVLDRAVHQDAAAVLTPTADATVLDRAVHQDGPAVLTPAGEDILVNRVLLPRVALLIPDNDFTAVTLGPADIEVQQDDPAILYLEQDPTKVNRDFGPAPAAATLGADATVLDRAIHQDGPAVLTPAGADTEVPRIFEPEPAAAIGETPLTGTEIDSTANEIAQFPAILYPAAADTTTDTPATHRQSFKAADTIAPNVGVTIQLVPGPAVLTPTGENIEVARELVPKPARTTTSIASAGWSTTAEIGVGTPPAVLTLGAANTGTSGAAIAPEPATVFAGPRAPLLIIPGQRLVQILGAMTGTIESTRRIAPSITAELPITAELVATGPITPTITAELPIALTLENPR
jgi:hypothetical protein